METEIHQQDVGLEFDLAQNHPNPFNPETRISFALPKKCVVEIQLFDMLGPKIRTLVSGEKPAGLYDMVWNGLDDGGRSVSSGIYFYTLKTEAYTKKRKMLLMR
jgi:flagellar hook assembly protein FlgD